VIPHGLGMFHGIGKDDEVKKNSKPTNPEAKEEFNKHNVIIKQKNASCTSAKSSSVVS
jgi:hypothetical protein